VQVQGQESRAYYKFIQAIHSEKTKKLYNNSLKKYMEHYKISMDALLSIPAKTIEEQIIGPTDYRPARNISTYFH
jgi:hypothetical protein